MDIRRGLFRLWIVLTGAYVLIAGSFMYGPIKAEFNKALLQSSFGQFEDLVPILCGEARGVQAKDYSFDQNAPSLPPLPPGFVLDQPLAFDTCWYRISRFRPLYPEYDDLSDAALIEKLYTNAAIPLEVPKKWTYLVTAIGIATIPPLGVLIVGASLLWAFSGFKRRSA